MDQNQGLSDRDGDGYPDYFDHFPNDGDKYNEAWEIYLENKVFWDGIVPEDEIVDSSLVAAGLNYNSYNSEASDDSDPISALSLDLVLRLSKRAYVYSQYGMLLGETVNPDEEKSDLGYGIVPIGLFSKLGPINFRGEYRMQSENFLFSYWDQAYDLNRAIAQDGVIVTKESQLYRYGKLQGLFLNVNSSIMDLVSLDISYQNMSGEVWKEDDGIGSLVADANQTLMGKISLNTRKIAKLDVAEAFYQQSNVTSPFEFDPNETSISGYNLGFEVSAGMSLVYKSRTTYILEVNGTYKPVSSMQIETQIKL